MKDYCLYIHINKLNGKVYVGISSNPLIRWRNGYKYNKHFRAAIQKYGWDGFLHIIVRTGLTLNEAHKQERRWIYLYRANNPEFGYNQTKGGEGSDLGKDCYGEGGRIRHEKYYRKNRDRIRKRGKEYYEENKKERRKRIHENYEKNKENRKEYMRVYKEKNKEKVKEYMKEYYEKNKEKVKEYLNKNKEHRKEYMKEYYQKHKIDNRTNNII